MNDIEKLAQNMVLRQSFDFTSFPDAKDEIEWKGTTIIFDRITLFIYQHEIDEGCSALTGSVEKLLNQSFSNAQRQLRDEYLALLHYLFAINSLDVATFIKQEHPDFVITETQTIGLEVTKFTTKQRALLMNIARANFGQGKTAEEIKNIARTHFKHDADLYDYYDLDGTACISGGLYDVDTNKGQFGKQIFEKYKKYKNDLGKFDKFVVLCDAYQAVEVICEEDAKQVVEFACKNDKTRGGFDVHILYLEQYSDDRKVYKVSL